MPRKYEITLDTGQRYEVDWDGPDAPTAADVEAALPTVTSAQAEPAPSLFGRTMDVVGRIGNTLGRPGAVVAGAVKEGVEAYQQGQPLAELAGDIGRSTVKTLTPTGVGTFAQNPNFDQVLGQAGMQEGWTRAGLGFVGDVVADPLFFAKPAALAAKGLGKVASAVTDNSLVQRVTKPIKELISEPTFDHLVNQVPGTPTEGLAFGDMRRLGASRRRSAGEHAESGAQTFFHEVTDPAKRAKLAHAIDQGVSTGDTQLDALIPKWRQKMDELWQTQLDLGLVEPDQYRKNYVQYVTRTGRPADAVVSSATNALPASSFKREKFKTLADAVKAGGATDDLQEILAISTAQVEKAKRTDEFLREVKTVFGSGDAGPNMRKLNVNNIKVGKTLAKDLEGTYLPTEIADDLERAIVVWEKPTELDGIYKTGMKIAKTLMTTVNPGHHATNLVGNVHNMFIAGGMTLPEITTGYVSAAKMARAAQQGKNALPAIGKYSSDELFKWANEYEILGSSSQLGESVVKGVGERLANNPAFTTARKIGTRYIEEPARLALYLDQVRKGKTPAEAAIKVKNVLFDYAELTPKEKTLRDSGLIPFYSWMRKNIPLQIEAMVKNPRGVEIVGDLMDVPWNANQTQVDQTVVPEKAQRTGFAPSPLAGPADQLVMSRYNLPVLDVNRVTDPATLTDMLGPVFKAGLEFATGRNSYGGMIDKPTGLANPAPAASLLGLGLNPLLPDQLEGYITPTEVNGQPKQHDRLAWAMSTLIPTGVYGSTAKASQADEQGQPTSANRALAMRLLGMPPDVITGQDQQYEAKRRLDEYKRHLTRKVLLDK